MTPQEMRYRRTLLGMTQINRRTRGKELCQRKKRS